MAVRGRNLEGTAKGAKKRQQLGDGAQGALSEEGELQTLCGRLLAQSVQGLENKVRILKTKTSLSVNVHRNRVLIHMTSLP